MSGVTPTMVPYGHLKTYHGPMKLAYTPNLVPSPIYHGRRTTKVQTNRRNVLSTAKGRRADFNTHPNDTTKKSPPNAVMIDFGSIPQT